MTKAIWACGPCELPAKFWQDLMVSGDELFDLRASKPPTVAHPSPKEGAGFSDVLEREARTKNTSAET